jgi:hypothetical protein
LTSPEEAMNSAEGTFHEEKLAPTAAAPSGHSSVRLFPPPLPRSPNLYLYLDAVVSTSMSLCVSLCLDVCLAVSMSVCICLCFVYVYLYMYMSIGECLDVPMSFFACLYVYVYMSICIC